MRRHHYATLVLSTGLGLLLLCCSTLCAAACPEMENDGHFRKIYENDVARVFSLQLGRIESTASYCPQHPYFYVVTSESQTTDTPTGRVGWSHNWNPGEGRFVAQPKQHVIRNETATIHRAIFVELLTKLEFNPLSQNFETDDFAGDLGSAKTTWTVSVEHGAMSSVKTQLGPADKLDISGRTCILIAITDLKLQGLSKDLQLSQQDAQVISPEADFSVTNPGKFPVRFVTIAF
jgi:hypothetical protein